VKNVWCTSPDSRRQRTHAFLW